MSDPNVYFPDGSYLTYEEATSGARSTEGSHLSVERDAGGTARNDGRGGTVGPGSESGFAESKPTTQDKLEVMAHKMTGADLCAAIERICGNPKNAGARARRLTMGESLVLAALMAEEARRVRA